MLQALQSKTSLKEGQKTIQYEESPRGSEWGRGWERGEGCGRQGGKSFQRHERTTFSNNTKERESGGYGRGHRQRNSKYRTQCFCCHKYGHFVHKCWSNTHIDVKEKVNYVEEQDDAYTVILVCKDGGKDIQETWYRNTGASNHMWGRNELFVDLDEKDGHISFSDATKVTIFGKGHIFIQIKNDSHQLISNVYYVSEMKTNIISLGQLKKG